MTLVSSSTMRALHFLGKGEDEMLLDDFLVLVTVFLQHTRVEEVAYELPCRSCVGVFFLPLVSTKLASINCSTFQVASELPSDPLRLMQLVTLTLVLNLLCDIITPRCFICHKSCLSSFCGSTELGNLDCIVHVALVQLLAYRAQICHARCVIYLAYLKSSQCDLAFSMAVACYSTTCLTYVQIISLFDTTSTLRGFKFYLAQFCALSIGVAPAVLGAFIIRLIL